MPISHINVGILLPQYTLLGGNFTIDSGAARTLGALLAIRDVNNKTDGILDHLLPHTDLRFAVRNTMRVTGVASSHAIQLAQYAFEREGVAGVVGAATSDSTMQAATTLGEARIPLISPSAASHKLSDALTYPYFFRTTATTVIFNMALVEMISSFLGYSAVATAIRAQRVLDPRTSGSSPHRHTPCRAFAPR